MLGIDYFYTSHSSPYSLGCNNTCWNWHFLILDGITKYLDFFTLGCPFPGPTFWKPSGLVLFLVVGFFGRSLIKVYFIFSSHSFKYHANMSPLMCGFRGRHLVINSSYHTCISFIFSPLPYNTTYLFWLAISYGCPFFTMLVWSYHWWSRYPFMLAPLWEWTYSSSQYTLRYYYNYCFGEWSTCLEGGLLTFTSPHLTTNGYPYHQKWLLNLDGRHHYWFDSHIYGATNIYDDNTCNDDGCSREDTIICWTNEPHVMISFPLLLKRVDVFILVLIYFWPLVHKPLSHVINDFL
jgi:hypothetical protein